MFTNIDKVKALLVSIGMNPVNVKYIDRGVMTDKFQFEYDGEIFIIRCFPENRKWLAKTEFIYLSEFRNLGIKAPIPVRYGTDDISYVIYKKIDGNTLSDVFNKLTHLQKVDISRQIIQNYKDISLIRNTAFGSLSGFKSYSDSSWLSFLTNEINNAKKYALQANNAMVAKVCDMMLQICDKCDCLEGATVWSDFSMENVIIGRDNILSGFIDFEGLMSGDNRLGLGYLIAHYGKTEFVEMAFDSFGIDTDDMPIDFYAILRYLRLLPYQSLRMPNGAERTSLEEYLPYSYNLLLKYS